MKRKYKFSWVTITFYLKSFNTKKKTMTFVNGIPRPVLEQAQKCGGDKSDALYFQKLSAFYTQKSISRFIYRYIPLNDLKITMLKIETCSKKCPDNNILILPVSLLL